MAPPTTTEDLLDLKMLPAWANEPARTNDYADFEGEDADPGQRRANRPRNRERDRDGRGPRKPGRREDRQNRGDRGQRARPDGSSRERGPRREHRPEVVAEPLAVTIRFLPHGRAFDNVIAQIKSAPIAYSVFALARLFLEKPERYAVRLTMPEGVQLFQLGQAGAVASDRRILEASAFANSRDEFYTIEVTQNEPLKGNFSNVARCRLSGTLLGPTNHHAYQPQLRNLYETRFSRRMSFPDYQRQIEIVSDPAVVEQWKEQARNVTTYRVKNSEPPQSFTNIADAERHFRQTYLPTLILEGNELTVSGVLSRQLPDRRLARAIEDAWAQETRSPSKMMQELAAGLREAGLNIFRHRRGMLFVSPVRARVFGHERASVSASINAILEKVGASPGIKRKQLAEQLAVADADATVAERAKMTLATDLHWLIREGYVIEFNDGTLDLPRAKAPAAAAEEKPAAADGLVASAVAEPVVASAAASGGEGESQPDAQRPPETMAGTMSSEAAPVAGEAAAEPTADDLQPIASTEILDPGPNKA